MFSWSADTVRFMADACRRTDFHEKLTALLLPYLKPTDHICDAGCGLGYLSLALSPHAAHITAAERDAAALSVLRQELDARGITNVTPLCTDVLAYTPPVPFDAMVFCFLGSMEEILAATLDDARTFLTLYGGGAPAEDDLRAKLISTGDPDFPWQLPGVRRFGIIAFSTEEGEHI